MYYEKVSNSHNFVQAFFHVTFNKNYNRIYWRDHYDLDVEFPTHHVILHIFTCLFTTQGCTKSSNNVQFHTKNALTLVVTLITMSSQMTVQEVGK